MTATPHTQGKLIVKGTRLHEEGSLIDCVATMQVSNQPYWDQDARRIAACWNACNGVSTDGIEAIAALGGIQHKMPVAAGLVRHRDELLAAMTELAESLEWGGDPLTFADMAREAIAKATVDAP